MGEFYEEATRGRSASHNLQVKAALALLYHVLDTPNPFSPCHAPKFAARKADCATIPRPSSANCCANCARIKAATLAASNVSPCDRPLFYRLPIP